jgi:hypothetical protein
MFSSVVDTDRCPDHSSSVTLVRWFLNVVIHSYVLCCSKALFPYCAESLRWICAPGTLSAQKNGITAHCSSLVHVESGAAVLILL